MTNTQMTYKSYLSHNFVAYSSVRVKTWMMVIDGDLFDFSFKKIGNTVEMTAVILKVNSLLFSNNLVC